MMFDNDIAKQVVNAKVGELLVAFQTLSSVSPDTMEKASSELREAVGKIAEAHDLEDPSILLLLIKEFTEFAVFAGSSIKADRISGQTPSMQPAGIA